MILFKEQNVGLFSLATLEIFLVSGILPSEIVLIPLTDYFKKYETIQT